MNGLSYGHFVVVFVLIVIKVVAVVVVEADAVVMALHVVADPKFLS